MNSILDNNQQETQNNPPHYKQRIISAILIALGVLGFFALRIWVSAYFFDLLIGFLMIIEHGQIFIIPMSIG